MRSRGLLWRICSNDGAPVEATESILAHLRLLLNTRRGDCVTSPEYGVVDFADVVHDRDAGAQQLGRSIRSTMVQFEPRLRNVSVRQVPEEGSLTLRFEITAQLADARDGRSVRFATTVRPGGRIDVSR